jgi:hypothetical protein
MYLRRKNNYLGARLNWLFLLMPSLMCKTGMGAIIPATEKVEIRKITV